MAPMDLPRPRFLIIDDEESTRLQLARTCEQAMKLADLSAYDMILLDLLMPGVGGIAILRDIRAGETNLATPIIVVSVVSDPQTIEECLASGANAYHVKPVRRLELVEQVRRQLATRTATVK